MEPRVVRQPRHCSASYYPADLSVRATASADLIGENEWWISRVVVEPASERGKGTGGRLLEALKGAVREMGGRSLLVCPGGYNANRGAQKRFYRQHGFLPVGGSRGSVMKMEFPFDVVVTVGEMD